jgi:hypothetical protein
MKPGKEHRVPLSASVIAILEQMQKIRQGDFVFPGAKARRPLGNMALLAMLRRTGRGNLTTHGFRSSFRDWAAERTDFPSELAEMALAHAVGDKVEAAYRRGDLFEKRRQLMDAWSWFCTAPVADNTATVVSISAAHQLSIAAIGSADRHNWTARRLSASIWKVLCMSKEERTRWGPFIGGRSQLVYIRVEKEFATKPGAIGLAAWRRDCAKRLASDELRLVRVANRDQGHRVIEQCLSDLWQLPGHDSVHGRILERDQDEEWQYALISTRAAAEPTDWVSQRGWCRLSGCLGYVAAVSSKGDDPCPEVTNAISDGLLRARGRCFGIDRQPLQPEWMRVAMWDPRDDAIFFRQEKGADLVPPGRVPPHVTGIEVSVEDMERLWPLSNGGEPRRDNQETVSRPPIPTRRPGRQPVRRLRVKQAILADIKSGRFTLEALTGTSEKPEKQTAMAERYETTRFTFRAALEEIWSEKNESNLRQKPTTDK